MRIHADHQPYRKKPYVARWYEGTRQRNKFFASAAARDEFIQQLKLTSQWQDPVLPTIAPHQLIRWQQAIAIAPEADPVEVFKFWKAEQRKIATLERWGEPSVDIKPTCPPKNALRHSFVTYHVSLHRNPGKTALIVSHRDQDCLYRHYLGIANQRDAERYFDIRPS